MQNSRLNASGRNKQIEPVVAGTTTSCTSGSVEIINKHKFRSFVYQLLLLALVLSLYGGFIEWYLGWHALLAAWGSLSVRMILLATAMIMTSYLMRAYRIHDFFRQQTGGRYGLCVKVSLYHNLINTMLPFRAGELSFPLLLSRFFGIGLIHSGTALFWFRLLDLHVLALLAGIIMLAAGRLPLAFSMVLMLMLVVLPLALFYLHGQLLKLAHQHATNRPVCLAIKVLEAFPDTAGLVWRSWLITLANWLIKIAALAFILMLFAEVPYAAACTGVITGDLTSVLPLHSPAGVGSYAAGVTAGLVPWGIDFNTALRAGVNLHLFLLGNILLAGLFGWLIPRRTAYKASR